MHNILVKLYLKRRSGFCMKTLQSNKHFLFVIIVKSKKDVHVGDLVAAKYRTNGMKLLTLIFHPELFSVKSRFLSLCTLIHQGYIYCHLFSNVL